ncbi:MAG TPA: glycosyltransferase family 2 protein [Gaiellaceae bacterium]
MTRPDVSIIVVSYNARAHLERALEAVAGDGHEVIVVDNASTDGSPELVRGRFPGARLLELPENRGFGAGNNEGMRIAAGRYFLLLNSDAWPVGDAIGRLVAFMDANSQVGVAGPRIVGTDGRLQKSVRGFPTVWRIATEYFFLRKLAPRSRALNAFYGAGFDYSARREADFLMGAVLLLRRAAVEQVGGFDTDFFMFSEETDLCYRMRQAGWTVEFCPDAEFVHVGGASTKPEWNRMYREQLRGHLLFLAKHRSPSQAERARRMLVRALRLRGLVFRGERGETYRRAADWLASASAETLLESRG